MKNLFKLLFIVTAVFAVNIPCSSDDNASSIDMSVDDDVVLELHDAFAAFNVYAVTAILSGDGTQVYIETTGFPNHSSIYWQTDNPLYLDETAADVVKTTQNTFIGGGQVEASSFTVDATPDLTGGTVTTQLGTIGIAVSGSAIFNDQEGMGDLDGAAGSLDWAGAHKGPGVYHYHLEPTPITSDDDSLVGILLDGVFIYGRQCSSTGTNPTDLDA